jgi:hypothetical protein
MTAEPGDSPNLEDISGPLTPPPADPDDYTAEQIVRDRKGAKKPTPTELHDAGQRRHIADVCRERDLLKVENKRLHGDLNQLRGELGPLQVKHQKLEDSYRFSLIGSGVSTVVLTVGSSLVSTASIWPSYAAIVLAAGVAVLACGVLVYSVTLFFSLYEK